MFNVNDQDHFDCDIETGVDADTDTSSDKGQMKIHWLHLVYRLSSILQTRPRIPPVPSITITSSTASIIDTVGIPKSTLVSQYLSG